MPRMNILNTVEREAFNSPPVFSSFQRKQYFDFPSKLRRFAAGLRNPASQLGFLLSAGYSKAARRFFSPGSFHPRDIEYVARQLEPGAPTGGQNGVTSGCFIGECECYNVARVRTTFQEIRHTPSDNFSLS